MQEFIPFLILLLSLLLFFFGFQRAMKQKLILSIILGSLLAFLGNWTLAQEIIEIDMYNLNQRVDIELTNSTLPSVNSTGLGCTLSVNLFAVIPLATVDGVCFEQSQAEQVCCRNIAVAVALVNIKQECLGTRYCCVVKAKIPKWIDNVVVNC